MFYLELFAALDRHKVDYLLIGGLAVSLHGVERATYVSDERLRAFRALTPEQRLRWVEELAMFLRMAKVSKKKPGSN